MKRCNSMGHTNYLMANVFGWIVVLTTYFMYLPLMDSDYLWVGITGWKRNVVWMSILIAAVCFVLGVVMVVRGCSKVGWGVFAGLLMFMVGSALWAPMVWANRSVVVLLSLVMTSIGAMMMTVYAEDKWAKLFFLIVFLHVFLVDNVYWYGRYSRYLMK